MLYLKNQFLFLKKIPKKYIPIIVITVSTVINHGYWLFTIGKIW